MKSIITIIFFLGSVSAQTSPFNSYDVVLYPEYYFDGLMAEVDGEVNTEYLPLSFEMSVPENADSVFFVSGSASSEAEVNYLSILNRNNRSFYLLLKPFLSYSISYIKCSMKNNICYCIKTSCGQIFCWRNKVTCSIIN